MWETFCEIPYDTGKIKCWHQILKFNETKINIFLFTTLTFWNQIILFKSWAPWLKRIPAELKKLQQYTLLYCKLSTKEI